MSARTEHGRLWTSVLALALFVTLPVASEAQVVAGLGQAPGTVTVARGNSQVVTHATPMGRVMIADPGIADVVTVSSTEVVVNGIAPGTTTLLLWDIAGPRTAYTVRVTADLQTIQAELRRLFPNETISVTAVGNTVVLQGSTASPEVSERAVALVTSLEPTAVVLNHIAIQNAGQVMLRVRIAEVSRNALRNLGAQVTRVDPLNIRGDDEGLFSLGGPADIGGNLLNLPIGPDAAFSDAVNFFLFQRSSNVAVFIQALQREGAFRSLAEPNLITVPGSEASFLAGGEFPYPVLQGAGQGMSIQFQEFGVRLSFTPTITATGSIRLEVDPEVSELDFANGLELAGFRVPALLSRRAHTVVEVENGQTFAIAGLMDNQMSETVSKVPILGSIPILGALFSSTGFQQERTELLVLVTPVLIAPGTEPPAIPTGEIETWDWSRFMRPETPAPSDAAPGGDQ